MKTAAIALLAVLALTALTAYSVGAWLDASLDVSIGGTR